MPASHACQIAVAPVVGGQCHRPSCSPRHYVYPLLASSPENIPNNSQSSGSGCVAEMNTDMYSRWYASPSRYAGCCNAVSGRGGRAGLVQACHPQFFCGCLLSSCARTFPMSACAESCMHTKPSLVVHPAITSPCLWTCTGRCGNDVILRLRLMRASGFVSAQGPCTRSASARGPALVCYLACC